MVVILLIMCVQKMTDVSTYINKNNWFTNIYLYVLILYIQEFECKNNKPHSTVK